MRLGIDRHHQEIFAVLVDLSAAKILHHYHFTGDDALLKLKTALNSKRVICVTGLPKALVKIKELPFEMDLSKNALSRFCEKNILDFFPSLPNPINYDYEIIPKPTGKILRVVAIESQKITQIYREFNKQGFKLLAIDVNELALSRGLPLHQQLTDSRFRTALGLALWNRS
jgi:Tfp pilus assembly PilM family ATPase